MTQRVIALLSHCGLFVRLFQLRTAYKGLQEILVQPADLHIRLTDSQITALILLVVVGSLGTGYNGQLDLIFFKIGNQRTAPFNDQSAKKPEQDWSNKLLAENVWIFLETAAAWKQENQLL